MKIFIVVLGLMLVNVSIMSYKNDYAKFEYIQRVLENIAFESTEIAALSGDENEAQRYAEELLEYTIKSLRNTKIKGYRCDVYFDGDNAVVWIRMDVEKLFGFPFSSVTSIVAERKQVVI
jgi:hypothetical protein